jgi:hypothetical protein
MRKTPNTTQRAIGPAEPQDQADPAKVRTTMKRQKVPAFKNAPTQSMCISFSRLEIVGWALKFGVMKR